MKLKFNILFVIGLGIFYGLLMRILFGSEIDLLESYAGIMSYAFLFAVPLVIGFITGYLHEGPTKHFTYYIFMPWLTVSLFLAAAIIFMLEGFICIIMALPIFLIFASAGGLLSIPLRKSFQRTNTFVFCSILLLPVIASPFETQFEKPVEEYSVHSSIQINSNVDKVWNNIVKVSHINEDENRFSLFRIMGFPRPLHAELNEYGSGAVRKAVFDKGLFFTETVTEWDSLKSFRFTIDAEPESIPPTALDEHVTVGGRYFDMLEGQYRIEENNNGLVLHLSSRFKLGTGFNFYTSIWSKAIMADIQDNILQIIKNRCESGS